GEVAVLREGAHQQGRLDQGGGRPAHRLHQGARRGLLALPAQGRGAAPLRQELPPPLDQLPPPRPQARQLQRRGGRAHHQAPQPPGQQMVSDSRETAGEDGQRDQELLEHAHQEEADEPGDRPGDPPGDQQRPRRVEHHPAAAITHVDHHHRSNPHHQMDWGQGKPLKCPDLNLDLCISPPSHEDPMVDTKPVVKR
uniref:Uncharacterized protein n=1 Tax=Aegilops tauschii subsp. strangulata TaxID=200361 RepID=A0A453LGH3_AEGTS